MYKSVVFSLLLRSVALLSIIGLGAAPGPYVPSDASELEGAWKMVANRGQDMEDLGLQMVKILADGHFMFAFFREETQEFYSTGGGEYTYEDGIYTEIIQFHTIDPTYVGRSLPFTVRIEGNRWHHGGAIDDQAMDEVFEKIERDDGAAMIGAWRMAAMGNQVDDLRNIKKKEPQTWKLIADGRYSWATFTPKEGTITACGGGKVVMDENWTRETISYDMADSLLVGTSVQFQGTPTGESWLVNMSATRGQERQAQSSSFVRWEKLD